MAEQSLNTEERMVAVMFFGNPGSGESTLLPQAARDFSSGVEFLESDSEGTTMARITLNGKPAVLIDIPGLFKSDGGWSEKDANALMKALKKGYDYKVSFFAQACDEGLRAEDLVSMSKIEMCIRQAGADGAKTEFRVIVDQIEDDRMYRMYEENFVRDNFRSFFASMKTKGVCSEIKVDGVLLVRV
ncbi:hypothetical protein BC939DRAFT_472603 [Gamsiella multidivaricata]|uniref:uncharacterized protein n=1 Tax=Gamsiella multidivaricata TaxID=101098 RepID=UPI00221E8BBF|nr:uncharacterized protein BC939DRAFT_472603 [Gamsiella multidivaricata]KAG0352569.1 hypothetical protein BGZ54_002689 [Gamsiella multidivaricata]KAI7832367.1 hypothetical protein BC939DRAFT_472603 [Gamsiella multidivaricata]